MPSAAMCSAKFARTSPLRVRHGDLLSTPLLDGRRRLLRCDRARSYRLRDHGGGERRGGARGNRKTAPGSYPDGYPTADHGRLYSHEAIDPDHSGHLICTQRRGKEGTGGRLSFCPLSCLAGRPKSRNYLSLQLVRGSTGGSALSCASNLTFTLPEPSNFPTVSTF